MSTNARSLAKPVMVFQDDAGQNHPSRLQCLIANEQIAVRGILQNDNTAPRNMSSMSSTDAAKLIIRNAGDISKTVRRFNDAIRNERMKGEKAAMSTGTVEKV